MSVKFEINVPQYALTLDKTLLRKTLRAAGAEVAAVARTAIRRSRGTGAIYSKPGGGTYQASAPGEAPVSRTGALARSFKVRAAGPNAVTVKAAIFYAGFLETGAKGGQGSGKAGVKGKRNKRGRNASVSSGRVLASRPFLATALANREASIADRVRAAVIDGVKFQRVKP
jgi:hypothetical protein